MKEMSMKKLVWLVMATLLTCTACSKQGKEQEGSAAKVGSTPEMNTQEHSIEADFKLLDANHDGSLAKDEVAKGGSEILLANFDKFDASKDGKLSLQEITAYVMAQREEEVRRKKETFALLDTNKDSGISREEAEKGNMTFLTTNFEDIDSNKDGKLSLQELDSFSQRISDKPSQQTAQAKQSGQKLSFAPLFMALDKNSNGELSKDELQARPELYQDFDRIDSDHDGVVSPLEFGSYLRAHAVPAQMQAQGAQEKAAISAPQSMGR